MDVFTFISIPFLHIKQKMYLLLRKLIHIETIFKIPIGLWTDTLAIMKGNNITNL